MIVQAMQGVCVINNLVEEEDYMAVGVSVIIPCYNATRYIERCLDSFNFQYSNYEVIFVDDCSTDNTVELLQQYIQEKEIKARIIKNSTNLGPGPTRNRGVEAATKEYISFVDIDDTVEKDYFTFFAELAENGYDCIVFDATRKKDTSESRIPMFISPDIKKGKVDHKKALVYIWPSPYSKFYRTKLIQDNKIVYPSVMRGEDYCFGKIAIGCSDSIYYSDHAVYNYYDNPGSLVHRNELINEESRVAVFDIINDKLKNRNLDKELNEIYFYSVVFTIMKELLKSGIPIKECKIKYNKLIVPYNKDNSYMWRYNKKYGLFFWLLKSCHFRILKLIMKVVNLM